jgi:hypothetical protein
MAQGLKLGLHIPLWLGYAASTLIIFPLVIYGMKVLSTLQVWTTPLWLILMVAPFVYLVIGHPDSVSQFFAYQGESGKGGFDLGSTLLAAGVCLSLIAQIAEQNDYLRFMPPQTPENKRSWWTWLILAGPGWVFFGAIKQIVGLFLAVYLIANVADSTGIANQPVHQFLEIYQNFLPGWLAMTLAVVLVVISQIKINVTNAYSGSLAWINSFTRVTKHYPGRIVFLGVNLLIALILMEANMFSFLNTILGFYANCGMAWVVVVASDIVFNKYLLKLSPMKPEFRRGMLYAFNPVGFGSMHRRRPVGDRLLRWTRRGDPAVLTAGGDRFGSGFAARPRDRDQRQVLPAPHRRRHRAAHVRRIRQPVGRALEMSCVPSRLRTAGQDEVPDPRCARVLVVPEHRQRWQTTCFPRRRNRDAARPAADAPGCVTWHTAVNNSAL